MKKRKQKKNKCKNRFIIVGIIVVIAILSLILYINKKECYKVSSRVNKLKETIKKEDSDLIYKTVGWLRIQGTNIDYQIIHNKEDGHEYPAEKEYYLWTNNDFTKSSNNYIINGHNIFNLSAVPKRESKLFTRTEELMKFIYYDFVKKNKYMQLTIDNKDYLYKVFSVAFISGSDSTFIPISDSLDSKEMKHYINILKRNSIYDYDVDVNEKDKIITVTTCTRMFSDPDMEVMYVSGRLLRSDEKNKNYGVEKNRNYNMIEMAWEDVEDEEEEV